MTPYAESLIFYVMCHSKKSREEAIAYLNDSASPLWQISCEQPQDGLIIEVSDSGDD